MELRPFGDAAAFRARAQPFLIEREAEHNLLFGVLSRIEAGGYDDVGMWTLDAGGVVVAAAIRTRPYNLILSWTEHAEPMADLILDAEPVLSGVVSEAACATAFADRWAERRGCRVEQEMASTIYRLDRLLVPEGVAGSARDATPGDVELLAHWLVDFVVEAAPGAAAGPPELEPQRSRAERLLADDLALSLFWEVNGEPVAFAASTSPTPNGVRVGPVFTPVEHRRRGYGAGVTAEVSRRRLEQGFRFCFLHADRTNPTSNGVYVRIGYEPLAESRALVFRSG